MLLSLYLQNLCRDLYSSIERNVPVQVLSTCYTGDTFIRGKKTKMNKQTTLKANFEVSVEIGSYLKNLLVFENCRPLRISIATWFN